MFEGENLENKIEEEVPGKFIEKPEEEKPKSKKQKKKYEYSEIIKVYLVGGMVDVKTGGSIWRKHVEKDLNELGGYKVINPIEAESHLKLVIDRDDFDNFHEYVLAWEDLKATNQDKFRYGEGDKGGFRAIADFNYDVVDESDVIICHYDSHVGHGSVSEMAINYWLEKYLLGSIKPTYLEKPIYIHSSINLADSKNKKGEVVEKGMNERDVAHSVAIYWRWKNLYTELEKFKKRHIAKQRLLRSSKYRPLADTIQAMKEKVIKKEAKLVEMLRNDSKLKKVYEQ